MSILDFRHFLFKNNWDECVCLSKEFPVTVELTVCHQVHALNILRALYRDTRLGENIIPFIADGLQAAVLGFTSPVWAVSSPRAVASASVLFGHLALSTTLSFLLSLLCVNAPRWGTPPLFSSAPSSLGSLGWREGRTSTPRRTGESDSLHQHF